MFCSYCGREINSNASFCPFCGKAVSANIEVSEGNEGKEALIAAIEYENQKLLQLQEEKRAAEMTVSEELQRLKNTYHQLQEKNAELKRKLGSPSQNNVSRWCSRCGAPISEESRFCSKCGNMVE